MGAVGLDAAGKLKHLKRPDFLIYAQPLANRLRTLLANALHEGGLIETPLFWQLVKMDWNASVDPASSGANAVKYLGQYVQHSVISDSRVLAIEGEQVRIRIKNRDTGQLEERVMKGVEFIRRFLLHALPARFHRIRCRGFMHARGKPTLQWLQVLLAGRIPRTSDNPRPSVTLATPVLAAAALCAKSGV